MFEEMAIALGKRKRRSPSENSTDESDTDAQAIFRRHFEARFKPLPELSRPAAKVEPVTALEDEASQWSGIESDKEEEVKVHIVQHSTFYGLREKPSRADEKAFMSSKPPIAETKPPSTAKQKLEPDGEEAAEAANVKNDLALQRLLKEAHLLDCPTSFSPSGINRHKAVDLRLQSLGSKSTVFAQEKMPMSHRKGIIAKASMKEQLRRQQAKENGVILEKVVKSKRAVDSRRERGVGGPSVGKFVRGTLKLSKRDVAAIEGPKTGVKSRRSGKR